MALVDKIKIVQVPINRLKQAKYNPRIMSDKAFNRLKKSLEHFGTVDPLVVRRKDNIVIGGHQRLKAMVDLGYKKAPIVYIDVNNKQAKALNIQLNNPNSQGEWDEIKLAELLENIKAEIPDIEITGFDDDEVSRLIEMHTDYNIQEDEVPPLPKKPKTKLGDLYQLNGHRLLCGDATKIEDVERLMNGKKADMVFTDPPYGIGYLPESSLKRLGKLVNDHRNGRWQSFDEFTTFIDAGIAIMLDIMRPGACYYICMGWEHLSDIANSVSSRDAKGYSVLVWDRMMPRLTSYPQDYIPVCEFILYGWKRGANRLRTGLAEEQTTLWRIKTESAKEMKHITQKPVGLVTNAVLNSSNNRDVIVDLFVGSGSTVIACEQTNRICYSMEIEPSYCDVIIKRWENFTGQKAKKVKR